jgi:hypothetical protein
MESVSMVVPVPGTTVKVTPSVAAPLTVTTTLPDVAAAFHFCLLTFGFCALTFFCRFAARRYSLATAIRLLPVPTRRDAQESLGLIVPY